MPELTVELRLLAYSALVCILMWLPYVLARTQFWGLAVVAGYTPGEAELPGWVQRLIRSHGHWLENLAPFAVLVLVAHAAGVSNEMTELGARLFFWGQVVRAIVHVAGIPWIRTGAFTVSWIGMVMIFFQAMGY